MSAPSKTSPSLVLESVTVKFGGLTVLDDLSLEFGHSPISSLIGPNGAGKTTVFNTFSGIVEPTTGRLLLDGEDITGRSPIDIARAGVVRKFQVPTVFHGITVADNLKIAVDAPRERSLRQQEGSAQSWEPTDVAKQFGLMSKMNALASELSHGERQWLEIGMAFLAHPRFLLLDEPAAGLGPEESTHTADLIKNISEHCKTIVIEHDMKFIRELGGDVTVLHQGQLLRHGSMEEIESDQVVRDVYLGREANA